MNHDLKKDHDLDMPEGLDDAGRRAYEIITAYLRQHERTSTGGCKAFYSPAEWKDREERYGTDSRLIVVYDGGALRPVFNMDAAYAADCAYYETVRRPREPYQLYEGMQEKLREAGLYFEECTGWFSAVYSTGAA